MKKIEVHDQMMDKYARGHMTEDGHLTFSSEQIRDFWLMWDIVEPELDSGVYRP